MPLEPKSAEEIAEIVRSRACVLPFGGGTKPRLSEVSPDVALIGMRQIAGITEYDPGEFTFTALAGTPIRDIVERLAAQGQYLPFDPVLTEAGATLGGTVAAGINGPGRIRYGGIRDFILAVQFVDGAGQLLRGGAKVVKNAAGFDLPKFLVGSFGRYGILVELTFKVFPRPAQWLTLCTPTPVAGLAERLAQASRGRWEFDALDYDASAGLLYARLGGPEEANHALANELLSLWPQSFVLEPARAAEWWREQTEFQWVGSHEVLLKVPITLRDLPTVCSLPSGCRSRITGAGNCAWIALSSAEIAETSKLLTAAGLTGLTVRGSGVPLLTAPLRTSETQLAVQRVFDPAGRFAALG